MVALPSSNQWPLVHDAPAVGSSVAIALQLWEPAGTYQVLDFTIQRIKIGKSRLAADFFRRQQPNVAPCEDPLPWHHRSSALPRPEEAGQAQAHVFYGSGVVSCLTWMYSQLAWS